MSEARTQMAAPICLSDVQKRRVQALVAHFESVQKERMQDVPILNKALRVEAVSFQFNATPPTNDVIGEGVLITPWFMSLVRLPLCNQAPGQQASCSFERTVGLACFDFIGAHDQALGYYETCALFSPMFEFASHALAVETALAALAEIRTGRAVTGEKEAQTARVEAAPPAMPSRRFFLTGHSTRGAA